MEHAGELQAQLSAAPAMAATPAPPGAVSAGAGGAR